MKNGRCTGPNTRQQRIPGAFFSRKRILNRNLTDEIGACRVYVQRWRFLPPQVGVYQLKNPLGLPQAFEPVDTKIL